MVQRVQTLRSFVPRQRPPPGQLPGTLYVNWADLQLGVINTSLGNQDLIAIRFFTQLTNYDIGDFVIQGGQLYRAIVASPSGPFIVGNWEVVPGASAIAGYLASFLPLAGGTMLGPLNLAADPAANLQAATKQYVDNHSGFVSVGDTPPANPSNGAEWFCTLDGQLYVWYVDPTSSQWVIATSASVAAIVASTPPANPQPGQLWFDSSAGQLHVWDGSQWVVSGGGGAYLPLAGGTMTGAVNFAASQGPWPKPVMGVTDGSNAAPGQVGEYLTATGSAALPSNAAAGNVTTLALPPGDWDVSGFCFHDVTGFASYLDATISNISQSWTADNYGESRAFNSLSAAIQAPSCFTLGPKRWNVAVTTTLYFVAAVSDATSNCTATINARRMR